MKTVLVLATLAAAVGEALIAHGMKHFGDIPLFGANAKGLGKALMTFAHPMVLLGVAFTIVFFVLFSFSLSWADLSFVQPLTALSFVFGTLIAKYWLHEQVSVWRWVGVAVIVLGVVLVARDPRQLTAATASRAGQP